MTLSKREQAQLERLLAQTLTEACETAKAELVGFAWLTHVVDYARFPRSLQVIWVFDSECHRQAAAPQRLIDFSAMALAEAGVRLDSVASHISSDSEEACQRSHGGDWQQRLARQLKRG